MHMLLISFLIGPLNSTKKSFKIVSGSIGIQAGGRMKQICQLLLGLRGPAERNLLIRQRRSIYFARLSIHFNFWGCAIICCSPVTDSVYSICTKKPNEDAKQLRRNEQGDRTRPTTHNNYPFLCQALLSNKKSFDLLLPLTKKERFKKLKRM